MGGQSGEWRLNRGKEDTKNDFRLKGHGKEESDSMYHPSTYCNNCRKNNYVREINNVVQ